MSVKFSGSALHISKFKRDFRSQLLVQFVNSGVRFPSPDQGGGLPEDFPDQYRIFAGEKKSVVIEKFLSAGGFPLDNKFPGSGKVLPKKPE